MSDLETAIDDAYSTAMDEFEQEDFQFPAGFAKVQGLDGRSKIAQRFKDDDRFTVYSSNGSLRGPRGTTVSIDAIGGQSLDPKAEAYRTFISVMQEHGYLEDASVHTRWD